MMKFTQSLLTAALMLALLLAVIEARPGNAIDDNKETVDSVETADDDDVRSAAVAAAAAYYDLPMQSWVPNIPADRLQMLLAQYRPHAYLRSPGWNGMNELYRMPESKRQVRYRQCYFNPISCFKK